MKNNSRFIIFLFCLLILPVVSQVCAQSVMGSVSEGQDPRLSRTVSINLKSATIGQFLRTLTEMTAVKIKAESRAAEDRGIRIFLREASLSDTLNQIAAFFGWGIKRTVIDGEIVYIFTNTGASGRGDPAAIQKALAKAVQREAGLHYATIKPMIDAWADSSGDLEILKTQNPEIARDLENDPEIFYRVRQLSFVNEQERQRWIRDRISSLLENEGPQAKYELIKSQIAAENVDSPSTAASEQTLISLKIEDKTSFWSAIEMVSKQTGINIIADNYSRPIFLSKVSFEKASFHEVLNTLCRQAIYEWKLSGKFVRLRSRLWFYDELREPPLAVLKRWSKIKAERGKLSFTDLAALAASLTDDQIAGLADQEVPQDTANLVWEARNILKSLNEFRFYNMLDSDQVRAAQSSVGLPFLRMNQAQRDVFLKNAPPGDFLVEQAADSGLTITFTDNSAIFKYDFGLGVSRTKEIMVAIPQETSEVKESEPAIAPRNTEHSSNKQGESEPEEVKESE